MKQVLSVEEAAGESGLSIMSIRRAIKSRRLAVVRIGRRVLIQRVDFAAFLRGDVPPQSRPLTDDEVAEKLAALSGATHGEQTPPPAPIDIERVATALESLTKEITCIRKLMERTL